jgi:hypothetical protein
LTSVHRKTTTTTTTYIASLELSVADGINPKFIFFEDQIEGELALCPSYLGCFASFFQNSDVSYENNEDRISSE